MPCWPSSTRAKEDSGAPTVRRIVSSCQAAPGKGRKTFIGQLAATAAAGVAPGACREPLPDNPRYAAGKLSSTASILLYHIKYVHSPLNAERKSFFSSRVQASPALDNPPYYRCKAARSDERTYRPSFSGLHAEGCRRPVRTNSRVLHDFEPPVTDA